MSCKKFSSPRNGSLAYAPKKRARSVKQSFRAFEKDDPSKPVHLTGFHAYKAGMTHVLRNKTVKEKKVTIKEHHTPVTILEAPPMILYGIKGYVLTPKGWKCEKVLYSSHINESVTRRIYKDFRRRLKKIPKTILGKELSQKERDADIEVLKKCELINVLMHTQIEKIKVLRSKKAHISEIQVNGGTIPDRVEWALNRLEKEIAVTDVFSEHELIDVTGVTKGKGFTGVTKRWGTTILPRKSNKGKRKVACIGAWHPANVLYSVPRAGQLGFHRRTEFNKCIYKMGNGKVELNTEFDLTLKTINPMGGFPHYGFVSNDFMMLKGNICGPKKRVVTLRKNLWGKVNKEEIQLKFIDTSSKIGSGRFQTSEEKAAYFGILKKEIN